MKQRSQRSSSSKCILKITNIKLNKNEIKAKSLPESGGWRVIWQLPQTSFFPMRLQLFAISRSWRPARFLFARMYFSIDVVNIALENNLQKGEDESEEHPNLHHLHAARIGQRV
jgi:hypothetical protein